MNTLLELNTQVPDNYETQSNADETVDAGSSRSDVLNLQSQVALLTSSISDEALRLAMRKVLNELVFLLDYLSLVESGPRERGEVKEVLSIFHAVRDEAYSLVAFIENHAIQLEGLDETLKETLDSSAYAIKHEVRRIFESELALVRFEQPDQQTRGSLLRAQGVLTNCFQQCMINVARMFDDSVAAARLFLDWRIRRERSLILCRDLAALIRLVQDCEKQSLNYIAEQLTSFREGSMQYLMYKDWQEYETLTERIVSSVGNGARPISLLRSLGCYLETLLAQVKARAVLADLASEPFGAVAELSVS